MRCCSWNTAVGRDALKKVTSGSRNICVGLEAGADLTTENDCIIIGDWIRHAKGGTVTLGESLFGVPVDLKSCGDPRELALALCLVVRAGVLGDDVAEFASRFRRHKHTWESCRCGCGTEWCRDCEARQ